MNDDLEQAIKADLMSIDDENLLLNDNKEI